MSRESLVKITAKWLSNGAGLSLDVRESEESFFAYMADEDIVTKNEIDLEDPHALVLIGSVKNFPKLDVPTFVFGYEGGEVELSQEEIEEAMIVDNFGKTPGEAVENALEYLKSEFGKPAKGARPKFLVVAEFPLLAAVLLGTLTCIDFYFRSSEFVPEDEAEIDKLISAFVYATTWSRKDGLRLDINHLLDRPSMMSMVPFIKEHCGYLTPEIIKKAGLTKVLLAQEIEDRKAATLL